MSGAIGIYDVSKGCYYEGHVEVDGPHRRAFLREEPMDNRDGVKKDIFIYPLILGHVPLISWY